MKKNKIWVLLLFVAPFLSWSQQDYQFTQYMFNGLVYNPAYAGTHDYMQVTALARKRP